MALFVHQATVSVHDATTTTATTNSNDEASKAESVEHEHEADVWDLSGDALSRDKPPVLHTWEAFEGKHVQGADRTAYLSEAGPAAFNAMLASQDHGNAKNGSLPQDVSLRAFTNLVLGRSSVFFQWNAAKRLFQATLPDVPVAGFSPECSNSVIEFFVNHGSDVCRLYEDAAGSDRAEKVCPTVTALKRCIESVLDHVEMTLSESLTSVETVLQLQFSLLRSRELLDILLKLSHMIQGMMSDEEAIGALSDEIGAIVEAGSPFTSLLQIVLTRASQPWINALLSDLGFANASSGLATEKVSDHAVRDVGSDAPLDNPLHEHEVTPSFVDQEDWRIISQTKASLRLLRVHFPDDLPNPSTETLGDQVSVPPFGGPRMDAEHESQLPVPTTPASDVWTMDQTQLDAEVQIYPDLAYHDPSHHQDPTIRNTITEAFGTDGEVGSHQSRSCLLRQPSLSLLESLRPSIEEQASQVSRTLLRLLFSRCQLRRHLALQRSFHLFGNGDFVLRLHTALFSSETQSAERTRGKTPTSETVGLRLGARKGQHWPPASSELQLSLKDVLSDVYGRHTDDPPNFSRTHELPGGLSFTIRELPDAEIDRVMDATSIYALDFLKLQYAVPPPLDAIMTPTSMERYDDIFRFLLKLIRLQDATTRSRPSAHDDTSPPSRVMIAARHFVATLLSHSMDIGIDSPWKVFEKRVTNLEQAVFSSEPSSSISAGLHHLRHAHDACLDTIRERLFLKRKQAVLRSSLEDVFQAIMNLATRWPVDQASNEAEARFHHAVKQLVAALRDHADRPPKTRGSSASVPGMGDDDEDEDDGATKILLARLDWNSFYYDNVEEAG
nr:hypothetical protein CFP56_64765 [Quercus suber]